MRASFELTTGEVVDIFLGGRSRRKGTCCARVDSLNSMCPVGPSRLSSAYCGERRTRSFTQSYPRPPPWLPLAVQRQLSPKCAKSHVRSSRIRTVCSRSEIHTVCLFNTSLAIRPGCRESCPSPAPQTRHLQRDDRSSHLLCPRREQECSAHRKGEEQRRGLAERGGNPSECRR